MREIKFRAWVDSGDGDTHMVYQGEEDIEDLHAFMFFWADAELMQYTGLHDKNGKEIYEGDILYAGGKYRRTVLYDNARAAFITEEKRVEHTAYDYLHRFVQDYEVEIVGNIRETPTLWLNCRNEGRDTMPNNNGLRSISCRP